MNRNQYIDNATILRAGKTTCVVERDKNHRRFAEHIKDHDSINKAKLAVRSHLKANPLGGCVALPRGEKFPPTKSALPVIELVE